MAKDSMDLEKVRERLKVAQLEHSSLITKLVDETVSSIKEVINNIPDDIQVTAETGKGFVRDIGADKVEFSFKKPDHIEVGGSYSFYCIAKPDVNVDLFIRLPKECFHEKDYLNYRYHAKRCLYLCIIKKYLRGSSLIKSVKWSCFQNEARKPILVVYPDRNIKEIPGFSVRIIPTASSLFNVSKLNFTRNNLRSSNQEGVLQATPMYNTSILQDMFLEDTAKFMKLTFLGWKELQEALILLKVWARRRTSLYAYDCLNGFLISVIIAYLATESGRKCINKFMTAMQIFRVTLDFIANSKSWDNGVFFKPRDGHSITKEERMTYLRSFPVVICNPSFDFNMAFHMTENGLLELRDEAALALLCIDKCKGGGFDEIFTTKIDFPVKYDHCIRLNLKGNAEVHALGFCADNECWRSYEQKVLSLIKKALGNRVKCIRVVWRNTDSECDIEDGLSDFDREPLVVGISNSSLEEAIKRVVRGPSAMNKDEALEFRKFWGDKSELRQFKDGTIAESIEWKCDDSERHTIIKSIMEYVLLRHLSLSKESIMHVVDQLDFSLLHEGKDPISFHGGLLEAFDVLSKRLRDLNDIPLRVSSVQPLDSAFRCTSVCPPRPHPLAYGDNIDMPTEKHCRTCIHPLEVMIQLEGSGNWPMDDLAIEKTKTLFLLRIGQSLQNRWRMTCVATEENIDVFMSGYAFRLKILHERGLSLLKRQTGNDRVKRNSSADRTMLFQGLHSSTINGLRGRYPIYEPVVRLAKRWVAAHLFSAALRGEAIELLVAYLFVNPLPLNAPCSRITGFLRFLRLLENYDWNSSPLIVDINGDLNPDDEKEINDTFRLSRKTYKEDAKHVNPAMFLATMYDKASEAWTLSSPSSYELKRLAAYARVSAEVLTTLIVHPQFDSYGWGSLFRTPLENFDAVILLHRDKLPYAHRLVSSPEVKKGKLVARGNATKRFHPFMPFGKFRGSLEEQRSKLMVGFDPLRCYVRDIERDFSDVFKVWYDTLGGDAIGLTLVRAGSKKRPREDANEEKDVVEALKAVGNAGKGFVRSIYFLKATE